MPSFRTFTTASTSRTTYHLSSTITFHQLLPDLSTDNRLIYSLHPKIWTFLDNMTSKRKSVTFRENTSTFYPKSFDGSSSPAPITHNPATAHPSLELDPMYLTWLRSATRAQYPFIVNGMFATYVYRQNFDQHLDMKHNWHLQKVQEREAAVPALAEKYGPLGWGSLYEKVTQEAWVKNYRVRGAPGCVNSGG